MSQKSDAEAQAAPALSATELLALDGEQFAEFISKYRNPDGQFIIPVDVRELSKSQKDELREKMMSEGSRHSVHGCASC
jgi:hypothetical protein